MSDKFVLRDEEGNTLGGDEIDDEKIPNGYKCKIELMECCGVDSDDAKLIAIFSFAFPEYNRYFGGEWVAS